MNSQPKLELLPVSQLVTDQNIRHDLGDLAALGQTFVSGQPNTPPVVYPNGHGWVVEDGSRRVGAAKLMGIEQLWCVVKPIAPDSLKVQQLIADLQHKDLEPLEKAEAMRNILAEDPDLAQVQLAEQLGLSTTEVSQALGLLGLCQEVREALRRGDISTGIAELLIPLDEETQGRVMPEILKGRGSRSGKPTVRQAQGIIKKATVTNGDREDQEAAELARSLRNIREERGQRDVSDALLDNGEPVNAVHLHYWLLQALDEVEQAWAVHKPDGCSVDLRRKINDLAVRLGAVAEKIEEAT